MARRLGTTHDDIVVSHRDIGDVFPEVVRHAETPLLRTAPAPMFLLSRLVRDSGYKVVVTGEGADEVLAGYDIFREAKVREFWARDPESPARARAIELLYPWLGRNPNQAPAFARSFFARNLDPLDPALSHRPRWDATAALKAMLARRGTTDGSGCDVRAAGPDARRGRRLGRTVESPVARDDDAAPWLHPGLAGRPDADGALGRGPLPVPRRRGAPLRGPLPARHKMLGLDEKHLLKRAFRDLLPPEIVARPKQPYRAPDAAVFVGTDAPTWVAEATSAEAVEAPGLQAGGGPVPAGEVPVVPGPGHVPHRQHAALRGAVGPAPARSVPGPGLASIRGPSAPSHHRRRSGRSSEENSMAIAFGPEVLDLDEEAEVARIGEMIRAYLRRNKRKGAIVGVSGGIDSAWSLRLCVRAFGPERVFGLHMPESESADETLGPQPEPHRRPRHRLRHGGHLADPRGGGLLPPSRRRDPPGRPRLRRRPEVEDRAAQRGGLRLATALLRGGAGARRQPEQAPADRRRLPRDRGGDELQAAHPQDARVLPRRPAQLRRGRHAEPARVRPGLLREDRRRRGRLQADRPPVQDPGLPARRGPRRAGGDPHRPPTTDTYSLPQTQEEFYFSLPYARWTSASTA